jgi:hypothetical protein
MPTKMEKQVNEGEQQETQFKLEREMKSAASDAAFLRQYYPTFKSKHEGVKPPRFLPLHFDQHRTRVTLKGKEGRYNGYEVCIICGKVWAKPLDWYTEDDEYIGYLDPDKETLKP